MTDKIATLSPSFAVEAVEVLEDARPPHVLICVHGIRDDGAWCEASATALGDFLESRIEIVCVRYDRVSSYGFVLGRNRTEIRDDVISQIKYIRERFPESPLSVLCHSNGTKIIAEIILKLDFKLEWIFLCGSVCHIRDVNSLREISQFPINDAGINDWWPILAEALRPSLFGATGVGGFHRFPVRDRAFPYYHGGALTEEHIRNWVFPTLATGKVLKTPALDIGFKKHAPTYIRYFLIALPFFAVLNYIFIPWWVTAAAISAGWSMILKEILVQRWAGRTSLRVPTIMSSEPSE
jgi:hypothetical protein